MNIYHPGEGKAIGLENRSAVARGWEWKEKLTSKGHERIFFGGGDNTVLNLDCDSSYTTL